MPLPDNFNSSEHLQFVIRTLQNRLVLEEFSDLGISLDDLSISTGRHSLRTACVIQDKDSIDIINARLNLFYFVLRKARDLQAPLYGLPVENYYDSFEFKPQVKLLFFEKDSDARASDRIPVRAEISFRLMGETAETVSQVEANELASKIKNLFASPTVFEWRKGVIKASYRQKELGYQMIITAFDEAEARRVITKVLEIQNHNPVWDNLVISETKRNYPVVPGDTTILGKTYRKPRIRPIADVRFRKAELSLWGKDKPVLLVCDAYYVTDTPIETFFDT